MCGIYGSTKPYQQEITKRKMAQFRFRGPDYTGIRVFHLPTGELTLAHHRLSIIDLSERARQPMVYANDSIVVVLNGEIYNYRQLREQYFPLQNFQTTSDTEVLCAMYLRFGKECVKYLNGDFAFVVYDKTNLILFGAVDRLGCKPFYYHCGNDGFEFCSQLLPLCIGNNYSIDAFGRQCYMSMQYIPSPYTIVQQIRKLNPGEQFTYSLLERTLSIEQYWDLYDNTSKFTIPKSYDEALEQTQVLLEDAVRLRMNADVPIGTFLSGGIDSSTIALFASHILPTIQAYSVGFEERPFDESSYARAVAERIGIPFNHIVCSSEDALRVLDNLQQYYDEPMGDASAIPTSLLCQRTGERVRVALGGDGGDEMFFGYPRYLRYAQRQPIYIIPLWLRQIAASIMDYTGKHREALSLRMRDVQSLYMNRRPSNDSELFDATQIQQALEQCKFLYADRDIRRCFNDFDIKTLMCHAYNVKLDRASMRAALEVRTPMLDYRIAEYTRLLPIEYCYTPAMGQKRILRDLLYRELPRDLFERKKRGFGVPIGTWFRKELRDYLLDTLNEQTTALLPDFNSEKLLQLRDRHIAGKEDQTTLMWLCVNYIAWFKLFESITNNK